jgi:hypothetical protein
MVNIKRFISLSVFFVLAFQASCIWSVEVPKELFCPEKIECSQDKNLSSCKVFGNHLELWGELVPKGAINKGIYNLQHVQATYQNPYLGFINHCDYLHENFENLNLMLSSASDYSPGSLQWEAMQDVDTHWQINGYLADCENHGLPIQAKHCPLVPVPEIHILSSTTTNIFGIATYANGILINEGFWLSCVDSQCYQSIPIYQARDACSDTGLCSINLMAKYPGSVVDAGKIIVDMNDHFKIIEVFSNPDYHLVFDHEKNAVEIQTVR